MRELDCALEVALARRDLSEAQMADVLGEAVRGEADPVRLGALLVALRMKGESLSEVVGAARFLLRHAVPVEVGLRPVTDMVGTGGDRGASFNVSTTAALVAAGAGVTMAKHGNRAVSGKSGAADVLAACGFDLDCPPEAMGRAIAAHGIGFLFAPRLHPAFAAVAPVRRALGIRTLFNLLGPLVNPAGATGQVVGVFEAGYTEFVAECLNRMGVRRAFVVHAADGMDEISVCTPTRVSELRDCSIKTSEFNPRKYFPDGANFSELKGGDAKVNAQILLDVLSGKLRNGARDICLLNAAAAIVVGGKTDDFGAALEMARDSLDSGAALKKLKTLVEFSRQNV